MARIEMEGFDELNKMIEKMTLTEADERKAIRLALEPIKKEVQKNTPVGTGKLKGSIRTSLGKENGQIVGKVIIGEYYGKFQEYGTSRSQRNKGFFARGVRASKGKAMEIVKKEILGRLK